MVYVKFKKYKNEYEYCVSFDITSIFIKVKRVQMKRHHSSQYLIAIYNYAIILKKEF